MWWRWRVPLLSQKYFSEVNIRTWIQHNVSLPFMKNHFNSEKSSNGKSLWHLPGTVPLNFVFYTNALWSRNRARCVSSTFSYRQEDLGLKYIGAGLQYIGAQKFYFQYSGKEEKRKSYDKTRFCVSREGLPNGLRTFCLLWFMFKNKTNKTRGKLCRSL